MLFERLTQRLRERPDMPPLRPTRIHDMALSTQIKSASDEDLFGVRPVGEHQIEMQAACRAGLFLWNDDLAASHEISQAIHTPTGSFWHAIMHRREGDFSNANYWWRKTGGHPALAKVFSAVTSTLSGDESEDIREFLERLLLAKRWQPVEFIALCEKASHAPEGSTLALQRAQIAEIEALLDWCRQQA
jgi:hypothetical protein